MKLPRPKTRKGRIEIIPMIDAIFFLLVFFMYSTLSMVHMKGMGMAIPRPAPKDVPSAVTDNTKLVITVTARGEYQLNGAAVDALALRSMVQQRVDKEPASVVIVNVDPARTTQDLIGILDTVDTVKVKGGKALPVLVATGAIDAQGRPIAPDGGGVDGTSSR